MTATPFRFLLPMVLAWFSLVTSVVWAGEYFEKDGVAIRGYDPVSYSKKRQVDDRQRRVPLRAQGFGVSLLFCGSPRGVCCRAGTIAG